MNMIYVIFLFGIAGTTFVKAAPLARTECSPIIPQDRCMDALNKQQAETELNNNVEPLLRVIETVVTNLLNDSRLDGITENHGPYLLDKAIHSCNPSTDCIARSVYRFKCEVPAVGAIVKMESIRHLVQEQTNFVTEFKDILQNMRVIFNLKELISRYRRLNSCRVPESPCPTFDTSTSNRTEGLVLIKSIAEDFRQLLFDLEEAFNDHFVS